MEGQSPDTGFGGWIAPAGDVNGDRYADVLIAAPNADSDRGEIFLFLGSAEGLATTPTWTAKGESPGGWFGNPADGVGDLNGDGYDDVVGGASLHDDGNIKKAGKAYVFFGSAQSLEQKPGWVFSGRHEQENVGGAVSSAGDVNGDGRPDLVISAVRHLKGGHPMGRVMVFYGRTSGLSMDPDWVQDGDQPSGNFGQSVAGAGDVNGDGVDDLIVGSQHYDGAAVDEGRVFLFLGSTNGLAHAPAWTATYDSRQPRAKGGAFLQFFGSTVCGAGDVNRDGYADVLVAAYFADRKAHDEGLVFLYLGGPNGLAREPSWVMGGNQESALFGSGAAGVGDVNGDHFADVLIGAKQAHRGEVHEGGAFLFHGSRQSLRLEPDWSVESNHRSAGLGRNVARARDVNGDGFDDVLVAAMNFSRDGRQMGKVWLYYGGPEGLADSTGWTLRQPWWVAAGRRVNYLMSRGGWPLAIAVAFTLGLMAVGLWRLSRARTMSAGLAETRRQKLIEERSRLVRDLHDDVGSRLARLAVLSDHIGQGHTDNTSATELAQSTREVIAHLQRLVWATNPRHDTLESLASYLISHAHRYFEGTSVRVRADLPIDLPDLTLSNEVRNNLVLCVQEAFANVLKHAHASEVRLSLEYQAPLLIIEVADNGRGLAAPVNQARPSPGSGNGLLNLEARMKAIYGAFEISGAPGQGTRVVLRWQVRAENPD